MLSTAPYWAETDSSGNVLNASGTLFAPVSQQQIPSKTVTTFDGAGRATMSSLLSYGATKYSTSTTYTGVDRVDVVPPMGGTPTTTLTNTIGKTASLIQYLSSGLSGPTETTNYSYDQRGSMTSMLDPAGNLWSWTFDTLGRNISATDPDTGYSTTTYDNAGRVTSTTDARNQTLVYTYNNLDPANRKLAEYSGSTSGAKLATWTYDTLSKGQLTSSSSYVGAAAYTESVTGYDVADKPTGESVTLPKATFAAGSAAGALAGTYTTALAYNSSEQLVSQTDPAEGGLGAESMFYDYDQFGDVTGLHGTDDYLNTALYNPLFQLDQYSSKGSAGTGGAGSSAASVFSTLSTDQGTGRLMDIQNVVKSGAGVFSTVADRTYTYDNAGDVTSETTTADGQLNDHQCFTYDSLQDLTAAWTSATGSCTATPPASGFGGSAPYSKTYTVEPATGNRTSSTLTTPSGAVTTATYTYPASGSAHPHAVSSVSTQTAGGAASSVSYSYDASGLTTVRPGQSITYDATGKPVSNTNTATGQAQISVFDASGNLLVVNDPTAGITAYLGDTQLHVAVGSQTVTATRTYTAGSIPVAERTTSAGVAGSTLNWLCVDAQNTASVEVNATTGAVTRRYQDPFGANRAGTIAPAWSSTNTYLNAPASPRPDSFN